MSSIHPDAKICPACLLQQKTSAIESFGKILKWLGGIAAVISLIIGVSQVSTLVQSWSERKQAVEELVRASYLRNLTGDYHAAWKLMENALELDPSSALARKKQVFLAMKWVRNWRSHLKKSNGYDEEEIEQIIRSILMVLYRGAVTGSKAMSANAQAHIGYAGFILPKEHRSYRIDPMTEYKLALEKNPNCFYAHAFIGQLILDNHGSNICKTEALDKALQHFSTALAAGKERHYIQKIKFNSLLSCRSTAIREANSSRLKGEHLEIDIRKRLIKLYKPLWHMNDPSGNMKKEIEDILNALSPKELLDTYVWLNIGVEHKNSKDKHTYSKSDHRVIMIRLKENLENKSL